MDINSETVDQFIKLLTSYGLNVIGALFILFIGWSIAGWADRVTRRTLDRTDKIDLTLTNFLASTVRYLVIAFTLIAVLNRFGVQTASLIAVLGAAGLAIGLAMQGTLSNVAAGVMLLFVRPFKIGEYVEVAGQSGTVKAVNLFTTQLATPDNKRIVIPNTSVWGDAVVNYSHYPERRVEFILGIGYGDDINLAMNTIKQILDSDSRILSDPGPLIAVSNLGASSVDLVVRVWVKSEDLWPLKFDLNKRFKETFDAKGISIPYPQQDVHLYRQS